MTRNVIQNAGQSYNGVRATTPPQLIQVDRDPNTHDIKFIRGTFWLNTDSRDLWRLAGFDNPSGTLLADWVLMGTGNLNILHTDDGNNVTPTAKIINITGAGLLSTTGTNGPNTVTLHLNDSGLAQSFPTDAGTATPAAGVLNVLGGTAGRDVNTKGAGNTVHVDLNNAISLGDLADISLAPALTIATGNIILTNNNQDPATNQMIIFHSNTGQNGNISMFLNNVFIGVESGNTTMTPGVALFNVAVGVQTLQLLTTGAQNTAVGQAVLSVCTTGNTNTGVGFTALQNVTTGDNNQGIGAAALQTLTTGSQNVANGEQALNNLKTGSRNVAMGSRGAHAGAGSAYTTAESDNFIVFDAGVIGESNTTRIGAGTGAGAGQQNRCFISGIRGITTTNADAVAVLIDSAGQLGTISSSLRFKKNIEDMGPMSEDIYKLRPVSFDYKNQSSEFKSVGLIAEEVKDIMPSLVVYDPTSGQPESVKYHDIPILLLNELQKMKKRILELESKFRSSNSL